MISSILKKLLIKRKITGICIAIFFALVLAFFQEALLGEYHFGFMIALFIFVCVSSGFLINNFLNSLKLKKDQIEILMGLKLVLTSLIDLKDPYTEGHSRRVRDLTQKFCRFLKLPENKIENIATAAELHDIGKIGIPDSILKKPEKLNQNEFLKIKDHPVLGANSLKSIKGFDEIMKAIRHYHEKFDGTGYPDGLKKEDIPFSSRILTIVDAYDAMLHGRSYRNAFSKEKVLKIIESESGTQFDPNLTKKFFYFLKNEKRDSQFDPVCGMDLNNAEGVLKFRFNKHTYYFCSNICCQKFRESPEKYIPIPFTTIES